MEIACFLIRRDFNAATGLVVAGVLPVLDDTMSVSYTFGRVSEADRFGQSLFIHYSDASSGAELVDIILPNVSDELMDELLMQDNFQVHDTAHDQVLTFQRLQEAVL